jgi:hypothetical protein
VVDGYLVYHRQSLRLINDPNKGFFVPLFVRYPPSLPFHSPSNLQQVLSVATIIIGVINYGHPTVELVYALYWVYVVLAVTVSITMLMIWFNQPHDLKGFTPAYAFLVCPSSSS